LKNLSFFRRSAQRVRVSLALGLSVWLGPICASYGMDPNRAMSQYVHDQWGRDQGFPPGPVYGITQTSDGYLWIGTDAGLVRFDGWNFRLIKDDSGAFNITSILGLTSDRDGCLWIRLQDLSVVRYCGGIFQRPSTEVEPYASIEALSRTSAGELLMSKSATGALAFRGHRLQLLAPGGGLPKSPVTAVGQTGNGDVWMGTRDAGLFRFSGGALSSIRKGLPDLKVNSLLPDGDRELWAGTDGGVAHWNGASLDAVDIPASLGRFQALVMVRDRDGNVWIGTDSHGLIRLNSRGGFAALSANDEYSDEAITALFEDREGNLWIGHAGGVERLRDSAFTTYSAPEGLPTDGSNPVFVDSEGRVWFPPVSGGLWWTKDARQGRIHADGLDHDVVYSIAGGKGELWVGRQRGGLTQLRYDGDLVQARTYTHADGLAQDSIYSVYRMRNGAVWAGTLSAGASMLRNDKFTTYTVHDGLASNTVASLLEGSDGTMWFATPSGLSEFSNGQWRTYRVADGLPSDNVNCLLEDSSGTLWAGTAAGIAWRNGDKFETPSPAEPSALRNQILGMAEDRYGSLWISTSNRVLRLDRNQLRRNTLEEGQVREYGLADGLRGVEGVKRHQSMVADPLGRIWVSMNGGISVVDPARLARSSTPAIAHVQTIFADGAPIALGHAVHIPGGRQRITFGYAGLSFTIPALVRYKYRLEGFDRDWSDLTAIREAVYTNLPPGSYRFRLMARNPDGVWNGSESSVAFEVDPLFWQTWWFRLSAVLAFAIVTMLVYWFRVYQLTRALSVRFEERLAERTRIAQELHDTLLQGFLSASMQVHVAADHVPDDSSAKPLLNRSLELMRQVIDEGRNVVRGLRTSRTASLDLEQAFARIQQELASGHHASETAEFRVIVDGQRRSLHPILRDEVYRIGREALLNAFRHARAKKIEIELKYSPNNLQVLVRDDGAGIDPQVLRTGLDGHYGLTGMRERAARIGARFHVYSSAVAGTEIELTVPSHVAFRDQPESKMNWLRKILPLVSIEKPVTKNGHNNH
jgi:ligand-binding sensor domain-containing protein/signal transduction histidine kinase